MSLFDYFYVKEWIKMAIIFESNSRMYKDFKSWNPYVGCYHNCIYCVKSFQRQAKRLKRICEKCYRFEPHFHPERLNRVPHQKNIFACSMGDIRFAKLEWIEQILNTINKNKNKTFYLQTKNPAIFSLIFEQYKIPYNLYLGITAETDMDTSLISKAPRPVSRLDIFSNIEHDKKYITIEPILRFNYYSFVQWIEHCEPNIVYVGYESHGMKLPEPKLEDTLKLIDSLSEFTEVRVKNLRPAWYENKAEAEKLLKEWLNRVV